MASNLYLTDQVVLYSNCLYTKDVDNYKLQKLVSNLQGEVKKLIAELFTLKNHVTPVAVQPFSRTTEYLIQNGNTKNNCTNKPRGAHFGVVSMGKEDTSEHNVTGRNNSTRKIPQQQP